MNANQHPLINAILYADIFKFPLSEKELFKYSIGTSSEKEIASFSKSIPDFIYKKDNYYCLISNKDSIQIRLKRKNINQEKIKIAQHIASILKYIPSVQFIGLSGAVAMENATEDDDIDLFIITEKNTIWQTRFLVSLLLKILGKKRNKKEDNTNNKICLNMFMSKSSLRFDSKRQDLYTAHEITQLKSLINKNHTYESFLSENNWVKKYLPNAIPLQNFKIDSNVRFAKQNYIEKIAKKVQLWYMDKSRTIEEVSDSLLAFHPNDYKNKVLEEYNERRKKYSKI